MLHAIRCLVVGGSGDLGRAIVADLLARRAVVDATYHAHPEPLAALAPPDAARLRVHPLDVRDAAAVDAFADALADADRIPDVLIYNAGIVRDAPALAMADRDLADLLDVNLAGAHRVCRAFGPHLRRRRAGKILLVSSAAGARGGRGQANYAASKAGLEAFARSLALEMADRGVLVNAVAPGAIASGMTRDLMARSADAVLDRIALRRLGSPEEVAAFIAHLAAPDIGYITGQTFRVDGGFKL